VTFGIRPEDLYLQEGSDARIALEVEVVAVEALGPEVILIARLSGGQEIAARLGREFNAAVGSAQRLYADAEMMHFFDPGSGKSIAGS
jgi:ABC-type sugar transport system ATPase subunit